MYARGLSVLDEEICRIKGRARQRILVSLAASSSKCASLSSQISQIVCCALYLQKLEASGGNCTQERPQSQGKWPLLAIGIDRIKERIILFVL